jgi:hypothetical protein
VLINALENEIDAITAALATKQMIVSGNCPPGQAIRQVNSDGTVVCEVDDGGATGLAIVTAQQCLEGIAPAGFAGSTVFCPAGYTMTGGGHHSHSFWINDSRPVSNSWHVTGQNASSFFSHLCLYAACMRLVP